MPEVKIKHVISFTSEDPKFKIENLITGAGPWLSCVSERSGSIKAEFQLQKAVTIDYIDIGNHNSAMVCIEVGRSSWPTSQDFQSLLPTVVLMTAVECRSGNNSTTVRMFKKGDLDEKTRSEKWDRVRIVCSQPFKRNTQFGLAFLKLYTHEDLITSPTSADQVEFFSNSNEIEEKRRKLIKGLNIKQTTTLKMSDSIRSLETCRMNADETDPTKNSNQVNREINSPLSRGAKLVMARKQMPNQISAIQDKKTLEMEALNFLISLNLTYNDIQSLKVSHIREEFERQRNKVLSTREKITFKNISLDYATERLKKLENNEITGEELSNFGTIREEVFTDRTNNNNNNSSGALTTKQSESSSIFNLSRHVSAKRTKLREEEDITPQSPTGSKRNNLALTDCNVTPTHNFKLKSKENDKSIRKKPYMKNKTSTCTNGVWLSPKPNKTPSVPPVQPFQYSKINSHVISDDSEDDILVSDFGSPEAKNAFSSTDGFSKNEFKLGSKPNNKYGTLEKSYQSNVEQSTSSGISFNESIECPLCSNLFSKTSIEEHASSCFGNISTVNSSLLPELGQSNAVNAVEECPVCGNFFDSTHLKAHAENCANNMFD